MWYSVSTGLETDVELDGHAHLFIKFIPGSSYGGTRTGENSVPTELVIFPQVLCTVVHTLGNIPDCIALALPLYIQKLAVDADIDDRKQDKRGLETEMKKLCPSQRHLTVVLYCVLSVHCSYCW